MKVLIILVRFNKSPFIYEENSTEKNFNYNMPLGLPYISAVLKKNGLDVTVLNLNHMEGLVKNILRQEFENTTYNFVFMGGLSIYYPNIRDYTKYIRAISPETKIVLGGGLISSQPEIMYNLLKPDYIVIGEGEESARELLQSIQNGDDISLVDGIGYGDSTGNLVLTKTRRPIMDLDSIPFPDHQGSDLRVFLDNMAPGNYILYDRSNNPRAYPILMSRSCPYGCTFCYHQLGQKYRQRSIDNIMQEIKFAAYEYKINIFVCYDELFAYDRNRIIDFCTKINEFRKTVPWEITWNCSLRVDNIDDDLIKMMKCAGCTMISPGLESYSNTVLKSMKKHITSQQIDRALRIISENDVAVQGTFIFGDPAETLETAKETLAYFKNNQEIVRGGVQLGFVILFQGSPLYKYCIQKGLIKDEIEFIEKRAKKGYIFYEPMNLTDSLSTREFEKLKNNVMVAIYTAGYHISPVLSRTVDGISEVHIKCPYCHKVSVLKNMTPPRGDEIQNVGCRYCNGRFEMVSKYYPIREFLLKTVGFYNLLKLGDLIRTPVRFCSYIKKRSLF